MNDHISWFQTFYQTKVFPLLTKRPIVYFCAEFAFSDELPIFAGGLGVLAADFVLEASERKLPLVAVGLYYKEGYVCEQVDEHGQVIESIKSIAVKNLTVTPVVEEGGERLLIEVLIHDKQVMAQAWKLHIGSIPVYLLDTNVPENSPEDQNITSRLYAADKEIRLKQEVVLGIGGLRLIEKLHIHPLIYHMNEGNSAFLALELIRHEMEERQIDFFAAKSFAQKRIVFTNHTLVSAGNDLFNDDLILSVLQKYVVEKLQVPVQEILKLGKINENTMFSMTTFSLSLAGSVNAVSKLHAQKALKIWPKNPMHAVTNGINLQRWDKISDTNGIKQAHQRNKQELLSVIKKQTGQVWEEDVLLLGWARRMVEYKRPLAVIEDIKRFIALVKNTERPVRIVFAGEAHPSDTHGIELIKILRNKIKNELEGTVVYLQDYTLDLSHLLTGGCDVWLNTPIVGFEACGTSGMKAALNGALPLTTKDGWIDEADLIDIGWILDSSDVTKSFLDILEKQVIPLYYRRNGEDGSKYWEMNMLRARDLIMNDFSTTKMLREYVQKLYIPLIEESL